MVLVVPALAASAVAVDGDRAGESTLDPRQGADVPPELGAGLTPFETPEAREQFRQAVQETRAREERRAERLASPAARQERLESKTKHVGLASPNARALLLDTLGTGLEGSAPPDLEDLVDGRSVEQVVGDRAVVLEGDGERPPVLVETPVPVRATDEDGRKRLVDLSLEDRGDVFVPANAAGDVAIPDRIEEGIDVGPVGVVPAGAASAEVVDGDDAVFYGNAEVDTDVLVKPVTQGVEVFWQLRSPRAPSELRVDLRLPEGAEVLESKDGSVGVVRDGRQLSTVSAPVAFDAQGQPVKVAMAVEGDGLVLTVVHHGEDVAYPVVVDPVFEDWYAADGFDVWGSWWRQNIDSLIDLETFWYRTHTGNVPFDHYQGRFTCIRTISCYEHPYTFPSYDQGLNDGLHIYLPANRTYPAWSYGAWFFDPPGHTTQLWHARPGIKYLRMRGASNELAMTMFTGIWRPEAGQWAHMQSWWTDLSNHWNSLLGGGHPGPQQLWFGFTTLSQVTHSANRDAYMGAAIIEMGDPEDPSISPNMERFALEGTASGQPEWVTHDPSRWVQPGTKLWISPTAHDPGLGVRHMSMSGLVSGSDSYPDAQEPCIGISRDPCPADFGLEPKEISTAPLADGDHDVTLSASDATDRTKTVAVPVRIDGQRPTVPDPTGALWQNREGATVGQPVLSPGTHSISVSATDPTAPGTPESTVKSGVEKLEIRVDGVTVANANSPCPAGNCSRSLTWGYDTAEYGGRHRVAIVAVDGAGNERTRTFWVNSPANGELVLPVDGEVTSSRAALLAKANQDGFDDVEFQYRKTPLGSWTTVEPMYLTDDRGNQIPESGIRHFLSEPDRHTKKLIWDVRSQVNAMIVPRPSELQVRAVFRGTSAGTFKSQVATIQLDEKGLLAGNATEAVGPGSVDLLTGNYSVTATDAVLPSFAESAAVTRTYNSLNPDANPNGPFGPGWVTSAPVDGLSDYSSLEILTAPTVKDWVDVTDSSGVRTRFEKLGDQSGTDYEPEPGAEGLTLVRVAAPGDADDTLRFTLTDLDGVVTTFEKLGGTAKWVPSKVETPNAQGQLTDQGTVSYRYEAFNGEARLSQVVAPPPPNVSCDIPESGNAPAGCRALVFEYGEVTSEVGSRLQKIHLLTSHSKETVALFRYYTSGTHAGRLSEALDPRISPEVKTTYAYDSAKRLSTIAPAGEQPWTFVYNTDLNSPDKDKVTSVVRQPNPSTWAGFGIAYRQPLSGGGAPFQMAASDLDAWGQTDRPTDATTIAKAATGQSSFLSQTSYLNQDGRVVNVAKPGVGVSTTEYDRKGNVVRELSAASRAKALAAGAGSATLAGLIDTRRTYDADGLRLVEELGPQHEVKLDSGQVVTARQRTVTVYDEPSGGVGPAKPVHLPTTMTTGAWIDGSQPMVDARVTKTEYDWDLRKPTKTIVDATSGGLNIARQTVYNAAGLEVESRQPKSNGSDAGTIKTIYYGDSSDPACAGHPEWFNLPCKTLPAAQPGTAGLPDLPVTTYTYNHRLQPVTVAEQVGGVSRTTTMAYDSAGRKTSESITTAGSAQPQGLVAAYGFEEGTGTTVTDSSGNGNHGTLNGAVWSAQGKYGGALSFDGVNDNVGIPDSSSLDLTTGMTLSASVRLDAIHSRWQDLIFKERGLNGSYGLDADRSAPSKPSMSINYLGSWQFANGLSALATNQWVDVTGTWDGTTARLYVNGTLVRTQAMNGPIPVSTGMLRIGGTDVFGGNQHVDGLIDEVRIYNRALSATEIQADRDTSVTQQTAGGVGEPVPPATYAYSATTGRPTTTTAGGRTLTTGYDNLGRATSYTDADGQTSTTSYDHLDRPTSVSDGKGSQTFSYDSTTGQLTSLSDSHAGTFGASYDADGRVVSKTYPNGMKADTVYDDAGAPVRLTYTKTSNCSSNCVWIDEQVTESVHGQWRTHDWNLSSQEYSYDAAGRLTRVQDDVESPTAVAGCTIRTYSFDENSNRTEMVKRPPASGGACQPGATGTTTGYSYDSADRLTGTGIQYDQFGRTTRIPAEYAGGGALTYTYYANEQVRTISQDGATKTYALDPAGRQRSTVASGGTTHTETMHYADPSDSTSWSSVTDSQGQEVSWERTISGIDGDLAAIRTHTAQGDTTVLQLQNLHGDVVATASTDPNAVALTATFETDEYGNPRQTGGTNRRYGWLGGKERRTELTSGVIQMGVRSYVPSLGRFTSVDPIVEGSANPYEYAFQDPVNVYDLDGRCPFCPLAVAVGLRLAPAAARLLRTARKTKVAVRRGGRKAKKAAARINEGGRVNHVVEALLGPLGKSLYDYALSRGGYRIFGYGGRANKGKFRIGLGRHRNHEWFRISWGHKKSPENHIYLYKGRRLQ